MKEGVEEGGGKERRGGVEEVRRKEGWREEVRREEWRREGWRKWGERRGTIPWR